MFWFVVCECEPWYTEGVEDCATGREPGVVPQYPVVLVVDWRSCDEEKQPKSRFGEASVPQVPIGIRLDGGGVWKADRAAVLVMYEPPIASLENWNGFAIPFCELMSIAGEESGVSW